MAKLIFKDEVYAVVGAAMEVHREKGFGFSEPVYQECMEIELANQKIPAIESINLQPKTISANSRNSRINL
jgi:GxxExxY protein